MQAWARRVAADWPALEAVERGGWRLGWGDGVTKRANCGLVLDPGADVDEVNRFYRGHGLAPCAQVWPGGQGAAPGGPGPGAGAGTPPRGVAGGPSARP